MVGAPTSPKAQSHEGISATLNRQITLNILESNEGRRIVHSRLGTLRFFRQYPRNFYKAIIGYYSTPQVEFKIYVSKEYIYVYIYIYIYIYIVLVLITRALGGMERLLYDRTV